MTELEQFTLKNVIPATTAKAETFRNTEVGNAKRLVAKFGKDIKWEQKSQKAWLIWNEKRWLVDESNQIMKKARETVESIFDEIKTKRAEMTIAGLESYDTELELKKLEQFALTSESKHKLDAMISLAKSIDDICITNDSLDQDDFLLNTLSGTIDLKTGALRKHSRNDLITKMINLPYDPNAKCPRWEQFLEEIFLGDKDLIKFVKKSVGYSLTGSTRESSIFILHGGGANGKSVFQDTIMNMLGDYAQSAEFKTFTEKKDDSVSNDIARMCGKRFIATSEGNQNASFNESLMKTLTGGEKIPARFLFSEFFEFMPTYKIFLGTNYLPIIKGTDNGIWRRIKAIPFNATFENEKIDYKLKEKLEAEFVGILAWAVEGCLMWQADAEANRLAGKKATGLESPVAVEQYTNQYREDMDKIGLFISECCEISNEFSEPSTNLYDTYKAWSNQNHFGILNIKNFSTKLTEKKFIKKSTKLCKMWEGLKLKPSHELEIDFSAGRRQEMNFSK